MHKDQIDEVAAQILNHIKTNIIFFYGDMGAGKTTLISSLVKKLGSVDDVSSPTFSIVNEYEANNGKIYHFDLYRINDIEEALNFGIEDYLDSDNYSLVEWPEKLEKFVTDFDRLTIKINEDNTRTISINS